MTLESNYVIVLGGATEFFIVTVTNLLGQIYLSTHPPCGFGWIDGHVTSCNQGFSVPMTKGGREERSWERGWILLCWNALMLVLY